MIFSQIYKLVKVISNSAEFHNQFSLKKPAELPVLFLPFFNLLWID